MSPNAASITIVCYSGDDTSDHSGIIACRKSRDDKFTNSGNGRSIRVKYHTMTILGETEKTGMHWQGSDASEVISELGKHGRGLLSATEVVILASTKTSVPETKISVI